MSKEVWKTTKYKRGGFIVDIVFCSKELPKATEIKEIKYNGGIEKRKSVFFSISKPSTVPYDIDFLLNGNTIKFTISTKLKYLNSGINELNKNTKPQPYTVTNVLKTTIECKDKEISIEHFSISINGKKFKTVEDLIQKKIIQFNKKKVNNDTISLLTLEGQLTTILIIHTRTSPLSPLKSRNNVHTEDDDEDFVNNYYNDLANKFKEGINI
ncbi:hypothetical protein ACTA71_004979 [Dictyostelium dimigraforme]